VTESVTEMCQLMTGELRGHVTGSDHNGTRLSRSIITRKTVLKGNHNLSLYVFFMLHIILEQCANDHGNNLNQTYPIGTTSSNTLTEKKKNSRRISTQIAIRRATR
jgi:hypothetical protein